MRELLDAHNVPAVVCYAQRAAPGLIEYLSDFVPRHEAYLVAPRHGAPALFVQLYNHAPDARRHSLVADTRWGGADSAQTVAAHLRTLGIAAGRAAIAGPLPFQRYAALQRALPDVQWADLSGPLGRLRWIKSDEEIALMRRAARLTDQAMRALAAGVRPGLRDCDLPALMQAAVERDGGSLDLCFLASTPMSDPSVYVPAQNLAKREIRAGDAIITEIGVAVDGYAGQMHRPIAIGAPPTDDYRRLYDTAFEAYRRVCAAIRPGATAQDVLDAAEVISERGYTICDDLVHGFGGGYLPPVLRTRETTHGAVAPFHFETNMCIVVQPNVISRDERMGLQLGQLHVVTESGLEPLHELPLDFITT